MAVTDHANNAAAVAAGWARVQYDRGVGKSPRFISRYEKPLTGGTGESGFLVDVEASSDVDQATADTSALTALNAFRRARYGGSPGRASGDPNSNDLAGNALTVDVA